MFHSIKLSHLVPIFHLKLNSHVLRQRHRVLYGDSQSLGNSIGHSVGVGHLHEDRNEHLVLHCNGLFLLKPNRYFLLDAHIVRQRHGVLYGYFLSLGNSVRHSVGVGHLHANRNEHHLLYRDGLLLPQPDRFALLDAHIMRQRHRVLYGDFQWLGHSVGHSIGVGHLHGDRNEHNLLYCDGLSLLQPDRFT